MHLRSNRVCIYCHLINTEVEKTLKLRCKMTHDTIWWNARDFLLMVYMCQSCTFLRHCQPFTFMTSTIAASGIFILGAIAQGAWARSPTGMQRRSPNRGSGMKSPRSWGSLQIYCFTGFWLEKTIKIWKFRSLNSLPDSWRVCFTVGARWHLGVSPLVHAGRRHSW